MKKILILVPFLVLFLIGCSSSNKQNEIIKNVEVNSKTVKCVGVVPMQCLQVRDVGLTEWQLHYGSINGFDFKPGYVYTLKVKITEHENVPADSSTLSWSLIDIISKVKN